MFSIYTLVLIFLFLSNFTKECTGSLEFEKILHSFLLREYNLDIRPEPDHHSPVDAHFDVRIKKLVKLDVKDQVFVINAFTMLKWYDPQLKWNVSQYDGIKQITMGTNLIWTPDIVLYNTANMESFRHTDYYKQKALVTHTGEVIWTNPVTWRASCSFDVTWFPVDKQVCRLTFGSWTYTKSQLILEPWGSHSAESKHEHFLIQNGEWDIVDTTDIQADIKFPCCPESYSTFSKEFVLQRRSLYYFLYILLPLIALGCLFVLVFFIPPQSGERLGFGVTILLSITVYLLVISEALPEKSDNTPMLGICFITEFYLLCVALVLAVITMNLHGKTTKPPDAMLRFHEIFQKSLKKLCGNFSRHKDIMETIPLESDGGSGYLHYVVETSHGNVPEKNFSRNLLLRNNDMQNYEQNHLNGSDHLNEQNHLNGPENLPETFIEKEKVYREQWKKIATFLDHLFFIIISFFLGIIPIIVVGSLNNSGLSH